MKWLGVLLCGIALALAAGARADEIEVADVQLATTEDGLVLAADFAF